MKKKLYYQFAASCCLLLFVFLGYVVKFYPEQLTGIDSFFSEMLRGSITPVKTTFFKTVTQLGGGKIVALLCLIIVALLAWNKKYISAIWLFINTAVVSAISKYVIKYIFARERPPVEHLVKETDFSFPSGHALGSMLLYGTLLVLAYYFIQNKILRLFVQIILGILILVIGCSRIYLGVHYPTDILGGYLLGLTWILFTYPVYLKERLRYVYRQQTKRKNRRTRSQQKRG